MGKLITLISALGGTNGKIIKFADINGVNDFNIMSSKNFVSGYNTVDAYRKDYLGWPYNNGYLTGYSLCDSHYKWSKNTFYTGSPSNESSITFPNWDNLIDYNDSSNGGLNIENNRLVTLDEVLPTAALEGSFTSTTASVALDFAGGTSIYAPSIYIRYWSIARQSNSNTMRTWMPNLANIYIFADTLGSSDKFCSQWGNHNSLRNPLRIPVADFACKFHADTPPDPYNSTSPWYYKDDEHFIQISNAAPNLRIPSGMTSPFYVIIMFEVPSTAYNGTTYFLPGRSLQLLVEYNSGGQYSTGWMTFKASTLRIGNYMFNASSGYTDITGYSWGGIMGTNINTGGSLSSIYFHNDYASYDVVKKYDTGGWGT